MSFILQCIISTTTTTTIILTLTLQAMTAIATSIYINNETYIDIDELWAKISKNRKTSMDFIAMAHVIVEADGVQLVSSTLT
jgi:hypothetical protein